MLKCYSSPSHGCVIILNGTMTGNIAGPINRKGKVEPWRGKVLPTNFISLQNRNEILLILGVPKWLKQYVHILKEILDQESSEWVISPRNSFSNWRLPNRTDGTFAQMHLRGFVINVTHIYMSLTHWQMQGDKNWDI